MKKRVIYLMLALLLTFCISDSNSQEINDMHGYRTYAELRKAFGNRCKLVELKGASQKSCIVQSWADREFKLSIYDIDNHGEITKKDQICVPSWYGFANAWYEDLLGNGTRFIFVEFEGNTGTGTLQKILLAVGWHKDKWTPVLLEITKYDLVERSYSSSRLSMKYRILHAKTPHLCLQLGYKFSAQDEIYRYRFDSQWIDKLPWNNDKFSFYDEEIERKKYWNVPFRIMERIRDIRLSIKNIDVKNLCGDFLVNIGIMGIMKGGEPDDNDVQKYIDNSQKQKKK